jgi:5-dehydro-2-deoxygluconokinase
MPSWQEVESLMRGRPGPPTEPEATALDHVHWGTTRRAASRTRDYAELAVLAIDHRAEFEELAATGADAGRISGFKALGLAALDRVARGDPRFGVLLDGRFGFDTLCKAADLPYWIGRPIEVPRSRPLEFECSADVATELATWPVNHVVKCRVVYHPDDAPDLRERQERQLLRLFDASRKTRHELLLELILPADMSADDRTLSRAISRIYAIGVRPDWWKLAPIATAAAWRHRQESIAQADPLCRGVLLLGMSAPLPQIVAAFATAAPFGVVKGFAIGRSLFSAVARAWFAGRVSDEEAVQTLAEGLSVLVREWRSARAAAA